MLTPQGIFAFSIKKYIYKYHTLGVECRFWWAHSAFAPYLGKVGPKIDIFLNKTTLYVKLC